MTEANVELVAEHKRKRAQAHRLGEKPETVKNRLKQARGAAPYGFEARVQMTPSKVTSAKGNVKVTTVCWSAKFGEGGLGALDSRLVEVQPEQINY